MDGAEVRELIASLVDSLAWPLFALVIVWILRPNLEKLVGLIRTIRYKGLEVDLNQSLQEAASGAAEVLPEVDNSTLAASLRETADTDPRITILKSWASVEASIEGLVMANRDSLPVIGRVDRMSTRRRVQVLSQANLIDDSLASVLYDLGGVRNLIAHGQDISLDALHPDTIQIFSKAAAQVVSILEQQRDSV